MTHAQKVRYAVIGAGNIAQVAVLPGDQVAEHASIEAVVRRAPGDPQRHGRHRRAYLVVEQGDDRVEIRVLECAHVRRIGVALPHHEV